MAQEPTPENPSDNKKHEIDEIIDSDKPREVKKDRSRAATKIVIRRLPPLMTEEVFLEQVSPLPDHDYLCFVRADLSLGPAAFSRAYLNFLRQEDIFNFKDQYDGYVFIDKTGNEYSAVVEFAPFQRLPKKRAGKRKDIKAGTIEEDPAYIVFLQSLEDDIKDKENEHAFDYSYRPPENEDKKVTTTPLLEFLKQRRAERQRSRDERKEDRRKKERERELERRKCRDDEKRRKRADSGSKEKDSNTGNTASKQVLKHPNTGSCNEKDGSVKKFGKEKDVTVSIKQHSERKRDDEKSLHADKKYLENRSRDKPPVFKTNQTVRPKSFESRSQQNRRSVEDLRKKTQSRGSESQHNHDQPTTSRKSHDPKKPPNKFQEKEKESGSKDSSRFKELPRKNGKDFETRKNFKDEGRRNGDKRHVDVDHKKDAEKEIKKVSKISENVGAKLNRTAETTATDVVTKFRRFSLEDDSLRVIENSNLLKNSKPTHNSFEHIQKCDESDQKVIRLTGEEYSIKSSSNELKHVGKEQLQKGHFKKPYPASCSPKHVPDKVRRSSLDSGQVDQSRYSTSIRRNHSLELDRSREESVESSNDGSSRVLRPERRIKNKDRPSIEIYRPGMGRFSKQRKD